MDGRDSVSTFATRMAIILSGSSVNSFAQRCGLSEGSIRQYLSGTIPRMDKVVDIARAAGVRVEWLACGVGAMREDAAGGNAITGHQERLLRLIIEAFTPVVAPSMETHLRQLFALSVTEAYTSLISLNLTTETEALAVARYAAEKLRLSMASRNDPKAFVKKGQDGPKV